MNWAGVPAVATFGPQAVSGDAHVVTPEIVLSGLGCYSFAVILEPSGSPPISLPPGDPAETVLVIPQLVPPPFEILSTASSHRYRSGRCLLPQRPRTVQHHGQRVGVVR